MPHYTRTKGVCIGSRCAEHSTGKHRAYPFAVFNALTGETLSTHRTAEEAAAANLRTDSDQWTDYVDTREETFGDWS